MKIGFITADMPVTNWRMPHYVAQSAVVAIVVAMFGVFAISPEHIMTWYWWVIGISYVGIFFYVSANYSKNWASLSPKRFEKKLFWTSCLFRIFTVLWTFGYYYLMRGDFFDFVAADSQYYNDMARLGADSLWNGDWNLWKVYDNDLGGHLTLSDSGYILFLGPIYALVGKSMLLSRIVQCFLGAWSCLLVYRMTQRHFDEPTARLAALFCALYPSMAMYCGITLKEVLMTFLTTWFVERADNLIQNRTFPWQDVLKTALLGLSLFAFRTVLGAVLFLAFILTLVLSSSRVIKAWKRTLLVVLSLAFLGVMFSGQIRSEVEAVLNKDIQGQQRASLEHRYGNRSDGLGNSLAKYAGAAVFAPLIFTIPFPTMVDVADQDNQRMFMSGCYVKNFLSGFVILTMFILLLSGDWRRHVLPMSVMLGYLVVLVFSEFAQSERFHQPILPLSCMFAAYSITHLPKGKRNWVTLWSVACVLFSMGWAWFKLKGRGLI